MGRKTPAIARALLRILLKRLPGDGAGTPLVFAIDDSPTKRYGPHVEAPASITTDPRAGRVQVPLRPRLGSVWPGWSDIRFGGRSPCRSSCTCISEPRSAGWRPTTAGSSTRSWSWPPPRSSGWSSSWGRIAANLGGDRRGLRQATILEAGAGCGDDGDQPAAVRCRLVVVAGGGRSRPEAGSWPAAEVRQDGSTWPCAVQTRGWQTGLFSLYGRLVVKKYKTFLATYKRWVG